MALPVQHSLLRLDGVFYVVPMNRAFVVDMIDKENAGTRVASENRRIAERALRE